jgi:hypothetical protein
LSFFAGSFIVKSLFNYGTFNLDSQAMSFGVFICTSLKSLISGARAELLLLLLIYKGALFKIGLLNVLVLCRILD